MEKNLLACLAAILAVGCERRDTAPVVPTPEKMRIERFTPEVSGVREGAPSSGTERRSIPDARVRPAASPKAKGKVPRIPGSTLLLHVLDAETGAPLRDVMFQVHTEYPPALQEHNESWPEENAGPAPPYSFDIAVPGTTGSQMRIVAQRKGYRDSEPLIIASSFYHERIDPFRDGGVQEILLEHTFKLKRSDR